MLKILKFTCALPIALFATILFAVCAAVMIYAALGEAIWKALDERKSKK